MVWHNIKNVFPERNVEVLVWVNGHRGPSWRNNHALVAFLDNSGIWWEERHDTEPLIGVIKWAEFEIPEGE